jgi:nitrile hydratase
MSSSKTIRAAQIVKALGEEPAFKVGDRVRVAERYPVGHYRVPMYMRGKTGVIERVLLPASVNNAEEGFGRNAGSKRHYYRVAVPLAELWPGYGPRDRLIIEIFEPWLERA